MTTRVRLGAVVLPEYPWPETRRIWTGLEQLGLDHGWTFDHHSWRTLRDRPWYDAVATLSAVAGSTSRMRLGTLVSTPNFRHPAVLAKQVMTIDEVSGGRFVLGVGAGAPGPDALVLGAAELSGRERAGRFAEFVELSDLLLRNRRTTYTGRHFTAVDAHMVPGCAQFPRVPFAVAAAGPLAMSVAARYADIWVTIGGTRTPGTQPERESWQLLEKQLRGLLDACERHGRDPGEVGRLVNVSRIVTEPYSSDNRFVDIVGRCRELGFTDVVVNYPRTEGVFAGTEAAFESSVLAASEVFNCPPVASESA
jgi:alkanesulfonate monooxygenase SsuD/methylene tetrahydromethanopterin reductase-like flavin-dependent oxidoreductase (luciferase family)